MNETPAPLRAVAAWALPALSGVGTAGLGVSAIFTHSQACLIIAGALIGVGVITVGAARIIEAIYQPRPEIIKAKGEARAAEITAQGQADIQRIAAESEANALIARTVTRSELLIVGAEVGHTESAAAMLRQQGADPDLPAGRRLNDDALARLLAPPKPPTGGGKPRPGSGGAVIPINPRPLRAVRPPGGQRPERRELPIGSQRPRQRSRRGSPARRPGPLVHGQGAGAAAQASPDSTQVVR